jgi:hypothetical protein
MNELVFWDVMPSSTNILKESAASTAMEHPTQATQCYIWEPCNIHNDFLLNTECYQIS